VTARCHSGRFDSGADKCPGRAARPACGCTYIGERGRSVRPQTPGGSFVTNVQISGVTGYASTRRKLRLHWRQKDVVGPHASREFTEALPGR
jgi:hypothetical protein